MSLSQWKAGLTRLIENKYSFVVLLTLIISISRIGTWFYPFDNDHIFFYVIGREITEGRVLYLDIWDHKPPLIYYFNSLIHIFLGSSVLIHRIFFTVWMLIEGGFFYLLLKKILSRTRPDKTILLSRIGLLLYTFWRNLSQFAYGGNNTENFGLIFLIGMYYSYLEFQDKKNVWWLIASGCCLSVLVFLKPNLALLSLPIWVGLLKNLFIVLWQKNWSKLPSGFKNSILNSLFFKLPTLAQASFWTLYFYSQNALWEFWLATYEFNAEYFNFFRAHYSTYVMDVFF